MRRRDQVFRIPDAMPFDEAAGFDLTYGTAIHGWRRGALRAGESVLVLGAAGGCGTAAIQVAKAMGAFVVAAAGGPEKLEIARRCGADVVVDYREETVSERVKEVTGGQGRGPRVRPGRRCRLPRLPAIAGVERALPRRRVRRR